MTLHTCLKLCFSSRHSVATLIPRNALSFGECSTIIQTVLLESVGSRMEPGVRMARTRWHPQQIHTSPSVPVQLVSLAICRPWQKLFMLLCTSRDPFTLSPCLRATIFAQTGNYMINAVQGNSCNKQTITPIKQAMQLKFQKYVTIFVNAKMTCANVCRSSYSNKATLATAQCTLHCNNSL